ncbi:ABC transporter ATP-binding protein [Mesobacillus maritimus]|uniref:ABC transporter ATP-binding protein n=1 Tax=Mesobacillus maritimus TaxID=1643336 RepID=UPI0038502A4C
MNIVLKGIIDKLFNSNSSQPKTQTETKPISQSEIEALVDAKIKEHTATMQPTMTEQAPPAKAESNEDYTLTPKQIEYALSMIDKVKDEFELAIDSSKLTIKDLNRLIAYQRYKNKGTLVTLVKKGVLKRK